jgi:MFS family permease
MAPRSSEALLYCAPAIGRQTVTTQRSSLTQWQLAPFHLGAAAGPFGSAGIPVFFSMLMQAFDVDRFTLSLAVPAYMLAYAAIQLVSGSISDLTSRRGSIVLGFSSYGAATLLCALAPNFSLFLVGQVLQGITNAFMTPILMATLGDVLPPRRYGRAMGIFSSTNIAGTMLGVLVAGAIASAGWRLYYALAAFLTWGLALWFVVWFRRYGQQDPVRHHAADRRRELAVIYRAFGLTVTLLASLSFLASGAMQGAQYLFGEALRDLWGMPPGETGLILAVNGLAGLFLGPAGGYLIERIGVYRGTALGTIGMALSLVLMGVAPSPLVFALGNALLGGFGIGTWAALNTLAIRAVPEIRGTVSSYVGSAKFLVRGIAPFWFTPLYELAGPRSIFFASALLAALLLLPLITLRSRVPDPAREAVRAGS